MDITTRRIAMQLGRRPKRKQDQALDVVASAAQTWSKWQLGKRAGKGMRKGATKAAQLRSGKPSGLKGAVTGTPGRIAGVVALVGGLGAIVARKLKGGGSAEPYAPPPVYDTAAGPPAGVNPTAAAITHNAPPPAPLTVAPMPDVAAAATTDTDEAPTKVDVAAITATAEDPDEAPSAEDPDAAPSAEDSPAADDDD